MRCCLTFWFHGHHDEDDESSESTESTDDSKDKPSQLQSQSSGLESSELGEAQQNPSSSPTVNPVDSSESHDDNNDNTETQNQTTSVTDSSGGIANSSTDNIDSDDAATKWYELLQKDEIQRALTKPVYYPQWKQSYIEAHTKRDAKLLMNSLDRDCENMLKKPGLEPVVKLLRDIVREQRPVLID